MLYDSYKLSFLWFFYHLESAESESDVKIPTFKMTTKSLINLSIV